MNTVLRIDEPFETQKIVMKDTHKYIGYGGARGGGKSWMVRTKAKLMALAHSGIRQLIVRRSYPELMNNHIRVLRTELLGIARYNDKNKIFTFGNGSTINFMFCSNDKDLDKLQGTEYDIIYIDEATQLSEYQIKTIIACCRGANKHPKRVYFTCNPGGQGHGYIKRIFIDKKYNKGEYPEEYSFIQSRVTDNKALMENQPEYIRQLEALPEKLRKAWLYGSWDIFEGQFFEDFIDDSSHYKDRKWTHVIEPFDIPDYWPVYRSYDYGYAKPFSCGYWTVDREGVIYRITELYGCTGEANEGVKWTPAQQFEKMRELENTHPYLEGKHIQGVADPAIFNAQTGESIAETAAKFQIYFDKGDNERIAGWMQCHYRLQFDENGKPRMYVFNTCKNFIRTIPTLCYSSTHYEDLDTEMEDHIADEWRYMCMTRPVKAIIKDNRLKALGDDPLDLIKEYNEKYRS